MNRGARLLLFGAALAMLCASSILAQDSVSLVGFSATRSDDCAVVELHATQPADFHVERFTMGNYVSVWADNLQAGGSVKEIPLDFERPDLADLATGVSLISGTRRSSIRVYLGPNADRARVTLMTDGDTATLRIPCLDPSAAPAQPAALDSSSDPVLATEPLFSSGRVEYAGTPEPAPSEQQAAQLIEPAPVESLPADASAAAADAGSSMEDISTAGGGSFFLPRQDDPNANSTVQVDGFRGFEPDDPQLSQSGAPDASQLGNADLNAQRLIQDSGDGGGSSASEPPPSGSPLDQQSMEELMREAMGMAGKMMQDAATGGAQQPAQKPTSGVSTSGSFFDPYKTPAQITFGSDTPEPALGKDDLSNIRIDLFEIVNTPLDQALTLLVAPTDYNIIVDSSVGQNMVSLSFKDSQTDLKSALDLLTRTYGLEYVVEAGTIVIAAKDTINGGLVAYETRLFVLSYADPTSIKDMLVTTGQLAAGQVEIYAGEKDYPKVDDSTQLSVESQGGTTEVKPIQTNLSSTPRNAILVKAVPQQMAQIAALIAQLDRRPQIIDLEVRVCEAQEIALKNLGIAFNGNDTATPSSTGTTWTEQISEKGSIEAFSAGSFYRSPLAFAAALNTQIQEGTVDVLAQPTLNTVEGKQAIYFAGEKVPYISKVSVSQGVQQIETDFLNIGITLNFKPRLDADGKITVDVNPIVSSLIEFRKIGDLVEAPRTSNRQLATTVRVGDCEPFVLAGLISETERETMTKIPLLGDLPLVGKLFRNKNKNGQRTEIIIVVTPHIHE